MTNKELFLKLLESKEDKKKLAKAWTIAFMLKHKKEDLSTKAQWENK